MRRVQRSWRGRFRVSCLFIYRIQRFLFLRIDSPIIWDYLNDKSFPSVSAIVSIFLPALSVCPYTVEGPSWSIRPQCVVQCASHPLAGVLARLFFPSPSSSVFPPTVTHFRHWTPNSNTEPVLRTFRTHTEWNACCFSVYAILHPSILCSSFPSLLEAVSMYANPVYELAKCTRKCIRRTINCRSSLEEVLRNYGKLGEIESTSA